MVMKDGKYHKAPMASRQEASASPRNKLRLGDSSRCRLTFFSRTPPAPRRMDQQTPKTRGLGGTEAAVIRLAEGFLDARAAALLAISTGSTQPRT